MSDRGTCEWGGDVFKIRREGKDAILITNPDGRGLAAKVGIDSGEHPFYFIGADSGEQRNLVSLKYAVRAAFKALQERRDEQVQAEVEKNQREEAERAARKAAQEEFASFLASVDSGEPWPGLDD